MILKSIDWFNLFIYSIMVMNAFLSQIELVLVFGFTLVVKSIRELK